MRSRLPVRWRKIWADLGISKARTTLVVLSIVVGIFAVGSIAGTFAILGREVEELWQDVDPASATLVTSLLTEEQVDNIRDLPEVDTVQVRRSFDVRVETGAGEFADLRLYAVPDYGDMTLNVITGDETGEPLPELAVNEAYIERSADDLVGARVGEALTVETPAGETITLNVTGLAYDLSQPSATVLNTGYGYVSMDTLEAITGETGVNVIDFRAAGDVTDEDAVAAIANTVRDSIEANGGIVFTVTVLPPGEPPGYVFVVALLLVLGVVGSLTFVLSGFLIVNIISALLAQQTRQIGVMKAIGARTGQVITMYLGMAAAFGVFALLLGLPLSYVGARGLSTFVGGLSNYKITDFSAPWWVFAVQIVIGLVVPVLAALVPVLLGTRVSVRQALDSRGIEANQRSIFNRLLAGLTLVPRPILLSFRNTFRQRGRLALTLLTLTLAGAIFATVFTVRQSLYSTLDDALGYDAYAVRLELDGVYAADDARAAVQSVESVQNVEAWTQATGRYVAADGGESSDIAISGIPFDSQTIQPIINTGRWLESGDEMAIVVNSNLAQANGIASGDTITLILRGQETTWTVVGVAEAVLSLDNAAWAPFEALSATIGEAGQARSLRLTAPDADTEAAQNTIVQTASTALNDAGVQVESSETRLALESSLDLRFNTLVGSLLALAALLALVGGLSIAGTTSINVLERMREIGVMRSVGAANYQILGIFIIEAVIVGIIGWVLGSILALPISRALSDGVGNAFSNAPLTYSFDVFGAVLWLVLALVLAFLASYFPARRASRLTLREVLSYDG